MFKLKVPNTEGLPAKVNQGNFHADLTAGSVETESREFADLLIREYGLTEVGGDQEDLNPAEANPLESEYPDNFPARDVLIGLNVAYGVAINLNADELTAYKGIGPKTAEEIIEFVENGGIE